MKTETPKKYNLLQGSTNEEMLTYLFNKIDSEKESSFNKIKNLVNENMLLKQQLEVQKNSTFELLNHNRNIVSIIAHDLRSPYQSLIGIIEFLLNNSNGMSNDMLLNYLKILHNSTNSSLSMLDNLLDWAIFDVKERTYKPCRVNLFDAVESVLSSIMPIAEFKKINIFNKIKSGVELIADYNMLQTIMRNLIMNAIQYNDEGGTVEINYQLLKNFHEIEISDDGFGLNEEEIQKFFAKVSVDETLNSYDDKWKGLGLHFCKEFILKHGGEIFINHKEQKGTSVKFTVPTRIFEQIN